MPKTKKNFRKPPNLPQIEEEILKFWDEDQTFEKSVEERPEDDQFVFYDGPPFATGLPHYGHILASTTKDVIPRFQTMKGKRVERVWGWDCHGLPIENIIEKQLDLDTKEDIEDFGVDKFNETCRNTVLKYRDEWKTIIHRLGRWVDMENDYKTMDMDFMESVWWVFKQLWDRDLIYQGYKSMHICPRCSTPLSNFEVTLGYQEVKDVSITVEFTLKEDSVKKNDTLKSYTDKGEINLLAWTTTPWTVPGNMLVAVKPDIDYVLFEVEDKEDKYYICAKKRYENMLGESKAKILETFKGAELIDMDYCPIFPYFKDTENAFHVVGADFVSTEEGTGLVHVAPAYGEDDYSLGKREGVDIIHHVSPEGCFIDEVIDFAGEMVKPRGDHLRTDIKILRWLIDKDKLFDKKNIKHSYPHCWRCDTPLLNYATKSWFVDVTAIKDQLIKNNQKINWVPEHFKEGRFGKWLEGARDWAISRNRYWGAPLPVWQSEDGDTICIGSAEELEKLSGEKVTDLHKHIIDKIVFTKNGKEYQRIPEVLDCWFESGSMPYGQSHYPFENKEKFEANFPAQFISEGQDQTRGWFYTLHVLATALTNGENRAIPVGENTSAFKNVVSTGIILAEDGKKMSKRLQNYPKPSKIWNKYGADSLRLYLMSSTVLKAESLNFSEKEVAELRRKVFVIWWNVIGFFKIFADQSVDVTQKPKEIEHILDRWIISKVERLTQETTQNLETYDIVQAARDLIDFINDLSNWYLRRSRRRLKADDNTSVSHVLGFVIYRYALLMAPIAPFFTDMVHHIMVDNQSSIHLSAWPDSDTQAIDDDLEDNMKLVQKIVELGHSQRREQGVRVRQPLAAIKVSLKQDVRQKQELEGLIKKELNIKSVAWQVAGDDLSVELDFDLTSELKEEGETRDLIREIQNLRKKAKLDIEAEVEVKLADWPKKWQDMIEKRTNTQLVKADVEKPQLVH